MNSKYVQCSVCLEKFTKEEIEDATCCLKCGTKVVPMFTGNDLTITLNVHEARVLTMWAANWAESVMKNGDSKLQVECAIALSNTIDKFRNARPDVEWTLGDALRMIREKYKNATINPTPLL